MIGQGLKTYVWLQASSGHSARHQTIGGLYTTVHSMAWCESIETTLRTRRLSWAGGGGLDERLPKRIVLENLEGAVRRGREENEK